MNILNMPGIFHTNTNFHFILASLAASEQRPMEVHTTGKKMRLSCLRQKDGRGLTIAFAAGQGSTLKFHLRLKTPTVYLQQRLCDDWTPHP